MLRTCISSSWAQTTRCAMFFNMFYPFFSGDDFNHFCEKSVWKGNIQTWFRETRPRGFSHTPSGGRPLQSTDVSRTVFSTLRKLESSSRVCKPSLERIFTHCMCIYTLCVSYPKSLTNTSKQLRKPAWCPARSFDWHRYQQAEAVKQSIIQWWWLGRVIS